MNIKYSATDPESIIANTTAAYTTTPVKCLASFRTRTNTTLEPNDKYSEITNTPIAEIVPTPVASGEINYIDSMNFNNPDTVQHELTVQWTDGSQFATLWKGYIGVNETIHYSRESGWSRTSATNTPVTNNRFTITGSLYETFDRCLCDEVNTSVLSTGMLSLQAIYIPAGTVVNSISFWSATTAAGTPTNQLFGLFDSSYNLLRSSTNDTTTAWAANSKKTLALTSSFTTTYSGIHYLGIMVTATTVPTLKGNTAKTGGQLGGAAPSMGGTSTSGLTTALPATAAAPAIVTTSFWGCIS